MQLCVVCVVLVIGQGLYAGRQAFYQIRCIPRVLVPIVKISTERIATQTWNTKAPIAPVHAESKLAFLVFCGGNSCPEFRVQWFSSHKIWLQHWSYSCEYVEKDSWRDIQIHKIEDALWHPCALLCSSHDCTRALIAQYQNTDLKIMKIWYICKMI